MHSEPLRPPRLSILSFIVSFPAVMAILFTPALPYLARFFMISEAAAKTSMTTYLFGYACGMLIYGPVANRWGRKFALLFGFLLAFAATVLTLWVGVLKIFWLFCLMRMLQGFGASSGMKISMTMVADTHVGEKATKAVSYLILSATLIPAVGLGIGGMLTERFGWEGCFVFMAIYTAIMIFFTKLLPETAKEIDRNAMNFRQMLHGYRRQFKDSILVRHALITGLCTSCYYFFTTQGPYISIDAMKMSPQAYGWLSLIPVFGMVGGCLIAARLAGRRSPRITMLSGLLVALASSCLMMIFFAHHIVTIASFFLLMMIVQIGVYTISPTSLAVAMNEASDKSNASATCQFINFGTSFVSVLVLSLLPFHSPLLLPSLLAIAMVIILTIWLTLRSR